MPQKVGGSIQTVQVRASLVVLTDLPILDGRNEIRVVILQTLMSFKGLLQPATTAIMLGLLVAQLEIQLTAIEAPVRWFAERFLAACPSDKGLNNRSENSHGPLRKREQTMQGFRSKRSQRTPVGF